MTEEEAISILSQHQFQGVIYNVVRRPLSGGKGTIVRHQATKGTRCSKCDGHVGNLHCPKCKGAGRTGAKPEETKAAFYQRVSDYIKAEPDTYFMRWQVDVLPAEIAKFRQQCLDPILEQLCDWWDWVTSEEVRKKGIYYDGGNWGFHFRMPYGIWNPLLEGAVGDYDDYLDEGSTLGLSRTDDLFPELKEEKRD